MLQYTGGYSDLVILWLREGTQFKIDEYDGYESIIFQDDNYWATA